MAVAAYAALARTNDGWSEVAQTMTDLFKPSSPKSCSKKSRTSRPRSPTKPITTMSASVFRAIMPMVDAQLSKPEIRELLPRLQHATPHIVPAGNHSLKVPARGAMSQDEVFKAVCDEIVKWIVGEMKGS